MKTPRHNKSEVIAKALQEDFLRSSLPPGALVSSTRDIAEQYQVSPLTAHKALRKLVDRGMLFRVRGSGTYLKQGFQKTQRIGIADSSLAWLYNKEMVQTQNQIINYCIDYLSEQNYAVQTISYAELTNVRTASRLLADLDGMLLSYNYFDKTVLAHLKGRLFPIILYRHEFVDPTPLSQVIYDFAPGIREAIMQLRITPEDSPILIYENTPSSRSRKKLWLEQLVRAGFSEKQVFLHEVCYSNRMADCFRLARVYGPKLRGHLLITVTDDIAASIIDALASEGLISGRDFRLLSIGNSEQYGFKLFQQPGIASIDMPLKSIALESCKLLIRKIRDPSNCQYVIRVPGHFIMRASATVPDGKISLPVSHQTKGTQS
jgi:DNA-binding LacI/PurR family transcriptional regulator